MKVSQKAAGLKGSEIIKLAARIRALQAEGKKIYNLTIGDFNPDIFPIPSELKAEIIGAYNEGITNYPPANGMPELRTAVSGLIKKYGDLSYSPDEIIVSAGARPLIFAAYQAIIDPGDKVLYPVPSWNNNHYTHLSTAEGVIIPSTPENNFMPLAEDLKPHLKGATLLALCSPLNPTGTVFGKAQLEEICDLVIEENKSRGENEKPLYIMFDQIYWLLTHGDTVHVHPEQLRPELRDYCIYIDGLSKAFAGTGVRVGWAYGAQVVIERMKTILSHVGAWSPKSEQVATGRYLSNLEAVDTYLKDICKKVNDRLVGLYEGFESLRSKGFPVQAIAPQAAIYLTVKIDLRGATTPEGKTLETNRDVHEFLLNDAGLAIVPFYAFGADEESPWYRISVGTLPIEELGALFSKLEESLAKLRISVA